MHLRRVFVSLVLLLLSLVAASQTAVDSVIIRSPADFPIEPNPTNQNFRIPGVGGVSGRQARLVTLFSLEREFSPKVQDLPLNVSPAAGRFYNVRSSNTIRYYPHTGGFIEWPRYSVDSVFATRNYANALVPISQRISVAASASSSFPIANQVNLSKPITVNYRGLIYDVIVGAQGSAPFSIQGTTIYASPPLDAGEAFTLTYTKQR